MAAKKPYKLTSGYDQQGVDLDYRDVIRIQAMLSPEQLGDVSLNGNSSTVQYINASAPGSSIGIATTIPIEVNGGTDATGDTFALTINNATSSTVGVIQLAGDLGGTAMSPTVTGPVLQASGSSHSAGLAPDPGSTAGTLRFLREDATWDIPPTMVAAGSSAAAGYAPAPPGTSGTTLYLREDATWADPILNANQFDSLNPQIKVAQLCTYPTTGAPTGSTSLLSVPNGVLAPQANGTAAQQIINGFTYVSYTSGSSIGSYAGLLDSGATAHSLTAGINSTATFVIYTGASLTSVRMWVGFTDYNAGDVSLNNPVANNQWAFRFDTSTDTNWIAYTSLHGGSSSTQTDTGIAPAVNTRYILQLQTLQGTGILFYINGTLVATNTTNLPSASVGQAGGILCSVYNLAASARVINFSNLHIAYN